MKTEDVSKTLEDFDNATQVLEVRISDDGYVLAKVMVLPVITQDPDPGAFGAILAHTVAHVTQAYYDQLDLAQPDCPTKAEVAQHIASVLTEELDNDYEIQGSTVVVRADGQKD